MKKQILSEEFKKMQKLAGIINEGSFEDLKKYQSTLKAAADFYRKKAEELNVDTKLVGNFNKGLNDLEQAIFDADYKKSGQTINEVFDTPQWPDAIRNFITTNLSNDEKELYLVVKALEKTLESFKNEMGEYDPNFHYGI